VPRTARNPLPTRFSSAAEQQRILADVRSGKVKCVGSVTLATGATSTVLRDALFGRDTAVVLVPTSAAGAALAWWQSDQAAGSVTLGHDAPAGDLVFLWIALG
jgi:hypothetical protein